MVTVANRLIDEPGFFGTGASLLWDLVVVSLFAVVFAAGGGFMLARRRVGSTHRVLMLAAYGLVAGFFVISGVHVVVDGFTPRRPPGLSLYNAGYFLFGGLHSMTAAATIALGAYQLFTGYRFTASQPIWAMPWTQRTYHGTWGRRTLVCLALTAVTGVMFYLWAFLIAA